MPDESTAMRRRDGVRIRHRRDGAPVRRDPINKKNEPRRRARTWGAPFGYLALFWTLAAFSFFWRAAQSEAERPSGTYLCFRPAVRGRAVAASSTASRARRHSERLSFVLGVSCAAARRAAAGRARQPARDAFFTQLHSDPAAPRGARRPAPRVGRALAVKLLKLVVRTLLAHPFTATDGLATLRGAKAVALPARARMTEVFILQIYPLLFLLSKSHDDMSTSR